MNCTIHTLSLDRSDVKVSYPLEPERLERRIELWGQDVALSGLGARLQPGECATLLAHWHTRPAGKLHHLAAAEITVTDPAGDVVATDEVTLGQVFLLETQATVRALSSQHYVFRAGERAASFVYADAPPVDLSFTYRLPTCDRSINWEGAMLSGSAAAIVGALVRDADEVERRAFAVGAIGPSGGCIVTDVLVPPGAGEAEPAAVDFDPADWAFAQDAVARIGEPFRLLGPLHTHPPGSLTPSPDDWDLFTWCGDAGSLYIIASMVGGQPTAAAYRWTRGSLRQVDLRVEDAVVAEEA